jgi:hypothetical protein
MPRCVAFALALGGWLVGTGVSASPPPGDAAKYKAAVERGRAEAEAELRKGRATLYTCGLTSLFENLDRETGLPESNLGCVIDDEVSGRIDGHNARISEYIAAHGPPSNSFKRYEKELFGLEDYFEYRCRRDRPIRLSAGGAIAKSPDGEYGMRLVKRPGRTLDGRSSESLRVVLSRHEGETDDLPLFMEDAELLWGPKGSGFALLRGKSRAGDYKNYLALDLWRMSVIRMEFGKK